MENLGKPYTFNAISTNMASGIYIFLLLDNDNRGADGKNNHFCVQYVRVWRLEPGSASQSSSDGTPAKTSRNDGAKS